MGPISASPTTAFTVDARGPKMNNGTHLAQKYLDECAISDQTWDRTTQLRSYIRAGLALVPIPHGSKGPNTAGWDLAENCITNEEAAIRLRGNIGLAHAYSSPPTCALDIDQMDKAAIWLRERGIDLQELLDDPRAVRIISGVPNKGKLLYRLPEGTAPLPTKRIINESGLAVIEFRCASASGKTVQDVLPPSIHPSTGHTYHWGGSGKLSAIPDAPEPLIEIWRGFLQRMEPRTAKASITHVLHSINPVRGVDAETAAVAHGEGFPYTDINQQKLQLAVESRLKAVGSGIGYDDWFKCACEFKSLIAEGWPEPVALSLFDGFSKRAGGNYDPVNNLKHWHQIRISGNNIRTWRSLLRSSDEQMDHPTSGVKRYEDQIDWSDYGNAVLMRNLAGGNLKFCHETKTAYSWDGNRWEECQTGAALQRSAIKVAEHYSKNVEKATADLEASQNLSEEETKKRELRIKQLKAWVITCRSKHRLSSMEILAVKMPEIIIKIEKLNVDRFLLGVQNGVVDLRTGSLRSAAREDFVTKYCGTTYSPTAIAPRWLKFIEEITGRPTDPDLDRAGDVVRETVGRYVPRPHLARYLQKLVGYFATGLVREDKMIFFTGSGGNGKDIFINCTISSDGTQSIS